MYRNPTKIITAVSNKLPIRAPKFNEFEKTVDWEFLSRDVVFVTVAVEVVVVALMKVTRIRDKIGLGRPKLAVTNKDPARIASYVALLFNDLLQDLAVDALLLRVGALPDP